MCVYGEWRSPQNHSTGSLPVSLWHPLSMPGSPQEPSKKVCNMGPVWSKVASFFTGQELDRARDTEIQEYEVITFSQLDALQKGVLNSGMMGSMLDVGEWFRTGTWVDISPSLSPISICLISVHSESLTSGRAQGECPKMRFCAVFFSEGAWVYSSLLSHLAGGIPTDITSRCYVGSNTWHWRSTLRSLVWGGDPFLSRGDFCS